MPRTGDLACNPGVRPDWKLNRRPFGLQLALNPQSYTSQGKKHIVIEMDTQMLAVNVSNITVCPGWARDVTLLISDPVCLGDTGLLLYNVWEICQSQ